MTCIAQETRKNKNKNKIIIIFKKKLKELIKEPTMKFSSSFLFLSETPIGSLKDHT